MSLYVWNLFTLLPLPLTTEFAQLCPEKEDKVTDDLGGRQ